MSADAAWAAEASPWAAAVSAWPPSASTSCSAPPRRRRLGQLAPLDDTAVGQSAPPSDIAQECRTGQDANERQDCRIVGVVNSVQKFWNGVFQRSGEKYQYVDTVFFTDRSDRVRPCQLAGRAVLLPTGQAGLHRPRLLRRAPVSVRRRRRAVRAGVRDRARVRPPCSGPARRPAEDRERHAGPGEQGGAVGAPGRLLRRACGRRTRSRRA